MLNPKSLVQFSVVRSKPRRSPLVPAGGDSSSHQHLDDFRKNEPVESIPDRQRDGMREHGKPAESSGEEHKFRSHGRQRGPGETA